MSEEDLESGAKPQSTADSLYANYLALRDAGQEVDFTEWARQFPGDAAELGRLHHGWGRFEARLDAVVGGGQGPDPASGDSNKAAGEGSGNDEHGALCGGRTIGDFRLLREVGAGGMGQVWEALQLSLNRRVALKVIRPDKASAGHIELFGREARAAGRINHPGIVSVHEHGLVDGVHWIAMELVEGGRTLEDELSLARSLPKLSGEYYRETAQRFLEIARAMQAAHAAGIVHRDVKPRNILMPSAGPPKVTDFGLARIQDESRLAHSAEVVGSVHYMSPEQALGNAGRSDARGDVFSLGVVFYEALTLRRPFDGDTVLEILRRIVREEPPSADALSRRVPRELALICSRAMEKRPQDRFQTMEQFADCLAAYLCNEPLPISAPGPLLRMRKWTLRHPTASSVIGLISLSMVAIVWLLVVTLRARADAVARAEEKDMLLLEYRAQQLVEEAGDLGPVTPTNRARFQNWIDEVRQLEARRAGYEAELASLRARGKPVDVPASDVAMFLNDRELADARAAVGRIELQTQLVERLRRGESLPDPSIPDIPSHDESVACMARAMEHRRARVAHLEKQRVTAARYQLPEAAAQERHDHLARLVCALNELCDPSAGLCARVEQKAADAERLRAASIEAHSDAWARAAAEIERDYGVAGFQPQLGLVPLGADPWSGLQEFWHLLSGVRPQRDGEGALRMNHDTGIVLILVPGGEFLAGAQSTLPQADNYDPWADAFDGPVRRVSLEPYLLSKFEMTQSQWMRAAGSNPSMRSAGTVYDADGMITELHPVERVNWIDCLRVLGEWELEIPTEEQWECAARAGTSSTFWTGSEFDSLAASVNFGGDSFGRSNAGVLKEEGFDDGFAFAAPVDAFAPNGYGFYCITGNIGEWCYDVVFPDQPALRASRGGTFSDTRSDLAIGRRRFWSFDFRAGWSGVRPARALDKLVH